MRLEESEGVAHGIDAAVAGGAQFGSHQVVRQRVDVLSIARLLRAIADVGDSFGGKRVAAHVHGRGRIVYPAGALQSLEEQGHRAHVESGFLQHVESDAVGLAFEIARVSQLRLHLERLRASRRARGHLAVRTRREDRQGQGDHRDDRGALPRADAARDVVLRQMGDFMSEHAGNLGFALRRGDEPRIDADIAAQHGERIDGWIAHDEEFNFHPGVGPGRDQAPAEFGHVGREFRIVEKGRIAAQVAIVGLADSLFQLRRQRGRGLVAEIGQVLRRRGHDARRTGQERYAKQAGDARSHAKAKFHGWYDTHRTPMFRVIVPFRESNLLQDANP